MFIVLPAAILKYLIGVDGWLLLAIWPFVALGFILVAALVADAREQVDGRFGKRRPKE